MQFSSIWAGVLLIGIFLLALTIVTLLSSKKSNEKLGIVISIGTLVLIIITLVVGCVQDKNAYTPYPTEPTEEIRYNQYTATQLFLELEEDEDAACKSHKYEYAEIIGELSHIDSEGIYISMRESAHEYKFIILYFTNDIQREKMSTITIGDTIMVKCYITNVGEIIGYHANIIDLKKPV